MTPRNISAATGRAALRALMIQGSPLGSLAVMAKYVGRFFQIPLPGFRPYVVYGPEANRQVLVTARDNVLWRNTDPVTELLRRGVLVVDGAEHDHYRRLMEPPLQPARLPAYTSRFLSHTNRVSAQWQEGHIVDMLTESRKIALLIIMDTMFSKDMWRDLPGLWNPILKSIEYISPGAWILWRSIPRLGFHKPVRELDQYLYGMIEERRRHNVTQRGEEAPTDTGEASIPLQGVAQNHEPKDLLQHLLDAGLTDDVIRDQMLTMVIAGHDTSTALLAWTFALLGQHPDIHARVVQEIDTMEKSPLLDQVIKESLRLYPPIHIGNRHVAKEILFGDDKIPEGERLFYSIYLTHRDPAIWENAEDFCPGRFAHGRKTPPYSYIPFGGGPRACIGSAFGQAEARVVLTQLLRTFTFEFTNHRIQPHMGATLEPRPGVRMKVTQRRDPSEGAHYAERTE